MMKNEEKIKSLIRKMSLLHINDDFTFKEYYDRVVEILSRSGKESVYILNILSKEEVSRISSAFGKIAGKLQSKEFIECVKLLAQKYPSIIGINGDVQDAIDAMD